MNRWLIILLLLSRSALAATNSIPARLQLEEAGAVAVIFASEAGQSYTIWYADMATEQPAQMPWRVAVSNLVAATEGETIWIDNGDEDRQPPGDVTERYYLVTSASTPPPVASVESATPVSQVRTQRASFADVNIGGSDRLARLKEAFDAGQLVGALAQSNYPAALNILREYGVAESTLTAMAARLGQKPAQVELVDDFWRASFSWGPRSDKEQAVAAELGFTRTFWLSNDAARPTWAGPHVGALWLNPIEPNLIRLFQWFDQNADTLPAVMLNSGWVNNETLKGDLTDAKQLLNGLHQLVKARAPSTFVWVVIVQWWDGSDERFARALDFAPDGVLLGNLDSFRSPFEKTLRRFEPLFPPGTPFVALDFHGYWPQVYTADPVAYGKLVDQHYPALETKLRALGYRGIVVDYLLLDRIHWSRQ